MPHNYQPGDRVRVIASVEELASIGIDGGYEEDLLDAEDGIEVAHPPSYASGVNAQTYRDYVWLCHPSDPRGSWYVLSHMVEPFDPGPPDPLRGVVSTCPPRRIRKAAFQPLPLP